MSDSEILLTIVVSFVPLVATSFLLGQQVVVWIRWSSIRSRWTEYQDWRVHQDPAFWLYADKWGRWIGRASLLVVPVSFLLSWAALWLVTGHVARFCWYKVSWEDIDLWVGFWTAFWFLAVPFSLGILVQREGLCKLEKKTEALQKLGDGSIAASSRADLIATYDALQVAHPMFWEEYADLPAWKRDKATNREHRERVAHYYQSRPNQHTRLVFLISLVTLIVAAISVVITLLRTVE